MQSLIVIKLYKYRFIGRTRRYIWWFYSSRRRLIYTVKNIKTDDINIVLIKKKKNILTYINAQSKLLNISLQSAKVYLIVIVKHK